MPMFLAGRGRSSPAMFLGVSIPVKFLNLINFGGRGPSKEDRLGGGGGSRSRSGSDGIVCVVVTLRRVKI